MQRQRQPATREINLLFCTVGRAVGMSWGSRWHGDTTEGGISLECRTHTSGSGGWSPQGDETTLCCRVNYEISPPSRSLSFPLLQLLATLLILPVSSGKPTITFSPALRVLSFSWLCRHVFESPSPPAAVPRLPLYFCTLPSLLLSCRTPPPPGTAPGTHHRRERKETKEHERKSKGEAE